VHGVRGTDASRRHSFEWPNLGEAVGEVVGEMCTYPAPAVMRNAPAEQLADLFAAFDVSATYDKPGRALRLSATLNPALVPAAERPRPPQKAVGEIFHDGADCSPAAPCDNRPSDPQLLWRRGPARSSVDFLFAARRHIWPESQTAGCRRAALSIGHSAH
jgi:hypothetical protein